MPRRVLILDTSVLCCYLQVPGKSTCGKTEDPWNYERICKLLETESKSTLVLPLAAIIETGNHIAQADSQRYEVATRLAELIQASTLGQTPWAAFTDQSALWSVENLQVLAHGWPSLAAEKITIGDATIKDVAEYYAKSGFDVEIITGDAGLKAYEPAKQPLIPRRRK